MKSIKEILQLLKMISKKSEKILKKNNSNKSMKKKNNLIKTIKTNSKKTMKILIELKQNKKRTQKWTSLQYGTMQPFEWFLGWMWIWRRGRRFQIEELFKKKGQSIKVINNSFIKRISFIWTRDRLICRSTLFFEKLDQNVFDKKMNRSHVSFVSYEIRDELNYWTDYDDYWPQ
jgi:hypothetical protein